MSTRPYAIRGTVLLDDGTVRDFLIDHTDWEMELNLTDGDEPAGLLVERLAAHIHGNDWLAEPPPPPTLCRWCGEEIGIIHYGNQGDDDRWQPTPALGEDYCADSPQFRHEPAGATA